MMYKGGFHVLCKDPFSILEIKKNGEATQLNFTRGSWAREEGNINAQTISPLWLGTVNDALVVSVDLPSGNGTSFTISKNYGKTLDVLYKDQQCKTINPALSYWELGEKNPRIAGTTLNNNASLIVADFDKNLKKIQSSINMNDPEIPDDIDLMEFVSPPRTLSCGPSFKKETIICVDEEGGIFATTLGGERKSIGSFTPHDKLHEISICGTSKGVHLLSTTMDGLGPAEFFRIDAEGEKITLYQTDVNKYARLSCTQYGAVAIMNDWVNSIIVKE